MYRDSVTSAISSARLATSSYEISENGAASPGRWQVTQLAYRIGAIVSVNVTPEDGGRAGGAAATAPRACEKPVTEPRAITAKPRRRQQNVCAHGYFLKTAGSTM